MDLILSTLHLADHPDDTTSWYHLSGTALGDQLGVLLFQPLPNRVDRTPPSVHQFAASIRRQLIADGYGAVVGRWAESIGAPLHGSRIAAIAEIGGAGRRIRIVGHAAANRVRRPRRVDQGRDLVIANVRVMTVHKSKGLEFDVVILPELNRPLAGQTDEVIVSRQRPTDPVSLVCRRIDSAALPLLPPQIGAAYRENRARTISESLCVLYVAMTRARHALFMLVESGDKAKHQKPSGILLATLPAAADSESDLLYRQGDPQAIRQYVPGSGRSQTADRSWARRSDPLGSSPTADSTGHGRRRANVSAGNRSFAFA